MSNDYIDAPYEACLGEVLSFGNEKSDRTGTGTYSLFGTQIRYDNIGEAFPLITTKRVAFKTMAKELLWILSGSTNVTALQDQGVHIWDEWADENGELGPVYGKQWRSWSVGDGTTIDQIKNVIEQIRKNPDSRRHLVTAWNPVDVDDVVLPPCHVLFQFYVADGKLSCQLYQRSADMFLGVPFNIASYALLTLLVADQTGLEPGDFIWTGGDTHIYLNHVLQVQEQLSRDPFPYPKVEITHRNSIDEYTIDDFHLFDYVHHPAIQGDVSV